LWINWLIWIFWRCLPEGQEINQVLGSYFVMVPEGLMEEPPEEVTAILKLFGIDSIHDVDNPTLH